MPLPPNSVENNLRQWNNKYAWPQQGDEWSELWGGAPRHWKDFILPRIKQFLPTRSILEIAPGYGRWTQFLADYCEHLTIVDLSPACIERCKERFAGRNNISYFTNDGRSLSMVEDRSLDFAFSFDSLVHANAETVQEYVAQLSEKLRPGASAFLHHSNAEAFRTRLELAEKIAECRIPKISKHVESHMSRSWRALDMSARRMVEFCRTARMACISQEIFAPNVRWPIDCISILENRPYDNAGKATLIDYSGLARLSREMAPTPAS